MAEMQSPRLKVLVSAYTCEPEKSSEPGIGWGMIELLASDHEIWVLTAEEHRKVIEPYVKEHPMPHVHWEYMKLPVWDNFLPTGGKLRRIHYHLWQIAAYFTGRRLHQEVNFDFIHHVTYGTYWTPSFLSLLPVPFIWGPVGGGESAPKAFYETFDSQARMAETIRDAIRSIAHFDPFLHLTARRAKLSFSTTKDTAEKMRQLGAKTVEVLPNIALPVEEYEYLSQLPAKEGGVFRIASIGRLLRWKGFHMGLEAFARFHKDHPESEYWIFGDGAQRENLEAQARELGLGESVKFWGNTKRADLLEKLAECDALLHPSLHDSGGYVCLEIMSAHRPVICLDLGGPGVQVTNETGFLIPAHNPEQVINAMCEAMHTLASDPELCRRMGEAGNKRVAEEFTWAKKRQEIMARYQQLTN